MSPASRGAAALVLAVALAIPLYTWAWRGVPVLEPDSPGYLAMADDLRDGSLERLWGRTAGYPILLLATGSAPEPGWPLIAAQLVLHGLAVIALAVFLSRVGVPPMPIALFAGIALSPPFVEHAAFVLSESLTSTLLVVGAVAWLRYLVDGRRAVLALAAVALGTVGLSHPLYVPAAPILATVALTGAALRPFPRALFRRAVAGGAVVCAALVIVVTSVSAYNRAHFGFTGLSPLLGLTLSHKTPRLLETLPSDYDGVREILIRHRDADLVDPRGDHLGYAYVYRAIPELEQATGLRGAELSGYLVRMNLALIARHPMEYLDEVGRSLLWYASPGVTSAGGFGSTALRAMGNVLRALVNGAFVLALMLLAGPVAMRCLREPPPMRRMAAPTPTDTRLLAAASFLALIGGSALLSSALTAAVWRLRVPVDLMLLAFVCLAPSLLRDLTRDPADAGVSAAATRG